MSVAHDIDGKIRTDDIHISENVDFSGLLLSKPVLEGLSKAGFKRPSPIQLKAIPLGRCGLDLIVQAKSGTGKTCVFSVIALEGLDLMTVATQVLILAPTREIAIQINSVVSAIGSEQEGLKSHVFIGGTSLLQDRVLAKQCHIASGTPGRVKQLIELGVLKTESIRLFVLDEADKLLSGDFTDAINWIYSALPDNKQILALSATYPEVLAQHLTRYMRNPSFVRLNITDPALLGIKQYHAIVPNHPLPNKVFDAKTEVVIKILSSVSFQQCLIFSNFQTRAQNLQSELHSRNWPTECIAGCLDQRERSLAMEQLKAYKCRILISTDLTSRGIDADKVNMVINLDVPKDHETYLHRIGRAGRFGSHGAAITIVSKGIQEKDLWAVERKCKTNIPKLPDPIPSDLVLKPVTIKLSEVVSTETIITRADYSQQLIPSSDQSHCESKDAPDDGDRNTDTTDKAESKDTTDNVDSNIDTSDDSDSNKDKTDKGESENATDKGVSNKDPIDEDESKEATDNDDNKVTPDSKESEETPDSNRNKDTFDHSESMITPDNSERISIPDKEYAGKEDNKITPDFTESEETPDSNRNKDTPNNNESISASDNSKSKDSSDRKFAGKMDLQHSSCEEKEPVDGDCRSDQLDSCVDLENLHEDVAVLKEEGDGSDFAGQRKEMVNVIEKICDHKVKGMVDCTDMAQYTDELHPLDESNERINTQDELNSRGDDSRGDGVIFSDNLKDGLVSFCRYDKSSCGLDSRLSDAVFEADCLHDDDRIEYDTRTNRQPLTPEEVDVERENKSIGGNKAFSRGIKEMDEKHENDKKNFDGDDEIHSNKIAQGEGAVTSLFESGTCGQVFPVEQSASNESVGTSDKSLPDGPDSTSQIDEKLSKILKTASEDEMHLCSRDSNGDPGKTMQTIFDQESYSNNSNSNIVCKSTETVHMISDSKTFVVANNDDVPQQADGPNSKQKPQETGKYKKRKHPKSFELSSFLRGLNDPSTLTNPPQNCHKENHENVPDKMSDSDKDTHFDTEGVGALELTTSTTSCDLLSPVEDPPGEEDSETSVVCMAKSVPNNSISSSQTQVLSGCEAKVSIVSEQNDNLRQEEANIEKEVNCESHRQNSTVIQTKTLIKNKECESSEYKESCPQNSSTPSLPLNCGSMLITNKINTAQSFSDLAKDFEKFRELPCESSPKDLSNYFIECLAEQLDSLRPCTELTAVRDQGFSQLMNARQEFRSMFERVRSERIQNPEVVKDFLSVESKSQKTSKDPKENNSKQNVGRAKTKRKRVNDRGSDALNWRDRGRTGSDWHSKKTEGLVGGNDKKVTTGFGEGKSFNELLQEHLDLKTKREEKGGHLEHGDQKSVEGAVKFSEMDGAGGCEEGLRMNEKPVRENSDKERAMFSTGAIQKNELNTRNFAYLSTNEPSAVSVETVAQNETSQVSTRKMTPDEECQMLDQMHMEMLRKRKEKKEHLASLKREKEICANINDNKNILSHQQSAAEPNLLPVEIVKTGGVNVENDKKNIKNDCIEGRNVMLSLTQNLQSETPHKVSRDVMVRDEPKRPEKSVEKNNEDRAVAVNQKDAVELEIQQSYDSQTSHVPYLSQKEERSSPLDKTVGLGSNLGGRTCSQPHSHILFSVEGQDLTDSDDLELSLSSNTDISDIDTSDKNILIPLGKQGFVGKAGDKHSLKGLAHPVILGKDSPKPLKSSSVKSPICSTNTSKTLTMKMSNNEISVDKIQKLANSYDSPKLNCSNNKSKGRKSGQNVVERSQPSESSSSCLVNKKDRHKEPKRHISCRKTLKQAKSKTNKSKSKSVSDSSEIEFSPHVWWQNGPSSYRPPPIYNHHVISPMTEPSCNPAFLYYPQHYPYITSQSGSPFFPHHHHSTMGYFAYGDSQLCNNQMLSNATFNMMATHYQMKYVRYMSRVMKEMVQKYQ